MKRHFFALEDDERSKILRREVRSSKTLNLAVLGQLEAERLYYSGQRRKAKQTLSWLSSYFEESPMIRTFIAEFERRIEHFSKMKSRHIGVILPLSGDEQKSIFGQKALRGMEVALQDFVSGRNLQSQSGPLLFTKDSKGNPLVGTLAVKELVEKHSVSFIVGGLYPESAKAEYLEARKYGVVYISLRAIELPREEKNHLLIEIPGSIESHVSLIFSEKFLQKLGRRVAILYPNDDSGEVVINEIWKQKQENNFEVTAAHKLPDDSSLYQQAVEKGLGLYFKRERAEEFELWQNIYKSMPNFSVRRLQTLGPVVDFDWIYLPVIPPVGLQTMPFFSFLDAQNMTFVGASSWGNRQILSEQKQLGKIYFAGDDPNSIPKNFGETFKKRFGELPRLIETLSYEGLFVGLRNVYSKSLNSREDLDDLMKGSNDIKGAIGSWYKKDNLWLKNIVMMQIKDEALSIAEID